MICPAYKTVFVHIAKTAGTSVLAALGFAPDAFRKHLTLADVRGRMSPEDYASYFKWCVVRNPWDRFVSLFHYRRERGLLRHPDDSFHDWLAGLADEPIRVRSQLHWMTVDGGVGVDRVVRFERLREDFAAVAERIGCPNSLPHLNRSRHGGFRSYYTPAARRLVEKVAWEDVQAFGYTFD